MATNDKEGQDTPKGEKPVIKKRERIKKRLNFSDMAFRGPPDTDTPPQLAGFIKTDTTPDLPGLYEWESQNSKGKVIESLKMYIREADPDTGEDTVRYKYALSLKWISGRRIREVLNFVWFDTIEDLYFILKRIPLPFIPSFPAT